MCPLLNNKITKQRTIRTFRQANISLVALIVSTFNKTENNEGTFRQDNMSWVAGRNSLTSTSFSTITAFMQVPCNSDSPSVVVLTDR